MLHGHGNGKSGTDTRNIYHVRDNDLYVNLFIASKLTIAEKGIALTQQTDFPASEMSTLLFQQAPQQPFTLHIRVPYWVAGQVTVTVNEQEVFTKKENGYLSITRTWASGDQVVIQLPMNVHKYVAKDNPRKQVMMYGPLALAGKLGREKYPETDLLDNHMKLDNHPLIDVPALVVDEEDPNQWIQQVSRSPLKFQTKPVAAGSSIDHPGSVL